jgi:hypothetical protein
MCGVNSYKANYRGGTAWILIITLQRKKGIETTATRPVSEIARRKNCHL